MGAGNNFRCSGLFKFDLPTAMITTAFRKLAHNSLSSDTEGKGADSTRPHSGTWKASHTNAPSRADGRVSRTRRVTENFQVFCVPDRHAKFEMSLYQPCQRYNIRLS